MNRCEGKEKKRSVIKESLPFFFLPSTRRDEGGGRISVRDDRTSPLFLRYRCACVRERPRGKLSRGFTRCIMVLSRRPAAGWEGTARPLMIGQVYIFPSLWKSRGKRAEDIAGYMFRSGVHRRAEAKSNTGESGRDGIRQVRFSAPQRNPGNTSQSDTLWYHFSGGIIKLPITCLLKR